MKSAKTKQMSDVSIVLLEKWPLLVVHRCSVAKTRSEFGLGCRFPPTDRTHEHHDAKRRRGLELQWL